MTEQTPQDAYMERYLIDLSKQLTAAKKRIEQLEVALWGICDGPRDADKSYPELLAEVRIEARAALAGEKKVNDLVKRLRIGIHQSTDEQALRNEAADRIETLETAFWKMMDDWDFWQSQETRNGFTELCASYWDAKAALGWEKKDG